MLLIDGSFGEGGGQVLRSSLALSMVTGRPFRMKKIRAGRPKPGLMRQHLTCVEAAARISSAYVEGAAVHSQDLRFEPNVVTPGNYSFSIGTAGSTTLVLQTVLPALLCAAGPSDIALEGGTHNPHAPPFDFLARVYLPLVNRMGPTVTAALERYGFAPGGGGRFTVRVDPAEKLRTLELVTRGKIRGCQATALVANLPLHVAERELEAVRKKLRGRPPRLRAEEVTARGPGNVVLIEIECEQVTEIFSAFGERGLRAESVGERAAKEARKYVETDVFAGEHLADQLLLPLAIAGAGSFTTLPLSRHSTTHIELINKFLEVPVTVESPSPDTRLVRIG